MSYTQKRSAHSCRGSRRRVTQAIRNKRRRTIQRAWPEFTGNTYRNDYKYYLEYVYGCPEGHGCDYCQSTRRAKLRSQVISLEDEAGWWNTFSDYYHDEWEAYIYEEDGDSNWSEWLIANSHYIPTPTSQIYWELYDSYEGHWLDYYQSEWPGNSIRDAFMDAWTLRAYKLFLLLQTENWAAIENFYG
jgi:hypothetical protein